MKSIYSHNHILDDVEFFCVVTSMPLRIYFLCTKHGKQVECASINLIYYLIYARSIIKGGAPCIGKQSVHCMQPYLLIELLNFLFHSL